VIISVSDRMILLQYSAYSALIGTNFSCYLATQPQDHHNFKLTIWTSACLVINKLGMLKLSDSKFGSLGWKEINRLRRFSLCKQLFIYKIKKLTFFPKNVFLTPIITCLINMLKPNFILHIKTRLFDIYSDSNKIQEVHLFFLNFKIISKNISPIKK
jgi:hypothetical protein